MAFGINYLQLHTDINEYHNCNAEWREVTHTNIYYMITFL